MFINQRGIASLLIVFVLLIGVVVGLVLIKNPQIFKPKADTTTPDSQASHRLGVRTGSNGKGEFFDKSTNQEFIFRGVNYIKLANQGHSTFDPGLYNPAEAQVALNQLQHDGYNSVRVFMNELTMGNPQGGLSEEYMQNLTDYIRRAKLSNIYVFVTFTYVPWHSPSYGYDAAQYYTYGFSGMYLAPALVEGKKRLVKDFVNTLKTDGAPLENVIYLLDNEVAFYYNIFDPSTNSLFTYKPFNQTTYTAPNGGTYNILDPLSKKQMMDSSMVYAVNLWRGSIKEADPDALVGIGFYSPKVPEANPEKAYVNSFWTLANPEVGGSAADFVDIHIYPDRYPGWSTAVDLEAFQIAQSNTRKPLIVGEFGAEQALIPKDRFNEAISKILDIQVESCQVGIKGWIFWQYDYPSDYYLLERGGLINGVLAPIRRYNPCTADINFPPPSPSVLPSPSVSPSPIFNVADINKDHLVNIFDFNIFVGDYLASNLRSDLNKDNQVNIFDFNVLVSNYGK